MIAHDQYDREILYREVDSKLYWFLMSKVFSADPKRDFKAIISWWQDMAQQNGKCSLKPEAFSASDTKDIVVQRGEIYQKHLKIK